MQPEPRPIVLASASEARRRMMYSAGLSFAVHPAAIDEVALRDEMAGATPPELATALAAAKARAVAVLHPDAMVIGSDQILACDGEIFAKPGSRDGVRATILRLKGKAHRLISAVSLVGPGLPAWHHIDEAVLWMRDVSPAFLDDYVAREGDAVSGSVGAYHVEGYGINLFDRIEGDHYTIQGMPLLPLLAELRRRGAILV